MIRQYFTRLREQRQENAPALPRGGVQCARSDLLLHAEFGQRVVRGLHRLLVFAGVVKLLRLVQLGHRALHLRIIGLHLGRGVATLLDELRAPARQRRTTHERHAQGHRYYRRYLLHCRCHLAFAPRIGWEHTRAFAWSQWDKRSSVGAGSPPVPGPSSSSGSAITADTWKYS